MISLLKVKNDQWIFNLQCNQLERRSLKKISCYKTTGSCVSCTPSSYGALGKFGEQKNAVVSFTILILIKVTIHRPSLKMLKLLFASTLSNSYTFMLSKLPACTITVWCTLKHESIIMVNFKNVLKVYYQRAICLVLPFLLDGASMVFSCSLVFSSSTVVASPSLLNAWQIFSSFCWFPLQKLLEPNL